MRPNAIFAISSDINAWTYKRTFAPKGYPGHWRPGPESQSLPLILSLGDRYSVVTGFEELCTTV